SAQLIAPAKGDTAGARSQGSVGGLVGVASAESFATNTSAAKAVIGNGVVIAAGNAVTLMSRNENRQRASASSASGGLIAGGGTTARASSGTAGADSSLASIGNDARITAGDLSLSASGLADNLAKATPGSGGLVSGVSAEATTRTQSRSRALVGDRAVLTAAGSARFEAAQENR